MFDNRGEMEFKNSYESTSMRQHVLRTFTWMGLGLLVTTVVAIFMNVSGLSLRLYMSSRFMPFIFLLAQIGLVVAFTTRLYKLSAGSAKVLFMAYAATVGITFSTLGYVFSIASLGAAFAITTIYFGCLVIIGYTTKMNLLRFGPLLYAGLITLIVSQLVMMLMGMDTATKLISALGLALFTGLTAYDAQKMKKLYEQHQGDETMLATLSVYSAFELYLDFINLFLYILRFVSKK